MAGHRRLPGTLEIQWGGRFYRRHPESKHRHLRVYWQSTTAPRSFLHRDIYVATHGPIPRGWHVHHIDHDSLNNDPNNLTVITAEEHAKHHAADRIGLVYVCGRCGDEFVSYKKASGKWTPRWCSPRCKEAQRRADGVAYVRPRVGKFSEMRKCVECGTEYEAKVKWARFCLPVCKGRHGTRERELRKNWPFVESG